MQKKMEKENRGERLRAMLRRIPKKVSVPVLCGLLLLCVIGMFSSMTATYLVEDGDQTLVVQGTGHTTPELLKLAGVTLGEKDVVHRTAAPFRPDTLHVYRAYSVHLKADGVGQDVILAMGSVSDVLDMADVELNKEDFISVDPDEPTQPDMEIVVNRVNYEQRVETETLPYQTVTTETYLLGRGQTRVVSMGITGKQETVYKDKIVDGKVVESTVVSSKVTREPQNQVVAKGLSPRMPHSLIEPPAGFELDRNGVPTHYKRVIRNAVSTAYSAKAGSYTASGMRAYQGTVAVNPKVIPYGTHLYITSADNRYVYGYAIAADTGTALKQGIIDVDLFFNSYEASCRWGKKKVNIYVLD